jgi:hypothetical protein
LEMAGPAAGTGGIDLLRKPQLRRIDFTRGKANPAGMTPSTVTVSPLTFTVRPTMLRSPPKARFHKPSR